MPLVHQAVSSLFTPYFHLLKSTFLVDTPVCEFFADWSIRTSGRALGFNPMQGGAPLPPILFALDNATHDLSFIYVS